MSSCYDVKDGLNRSRLCTPKKGLRAIMYWALAAWIATDPELDLPGAITHDNASEITTDIVFEIGEFFRPLEYTSETGMLENNSVGEPSNLGFEQIVEGSAIPSKELLGYLHGHSNSPMVFIVKEANGALRKVGSKELPAYFSNIKETTGKAQGDKKEVTFSIKGVGGIAPYYSGVLQLA